MKKFLCLCLTVLIALSLSSCALDHEVRAWLNVGGKTPIYQDPDRDTDISQKDYSSLLSDAEMKYTVETKNGVEYYFYSSGDTVVLKAMNVTEEYEGHDAELPSKTSLGADITSVNFNSFYSCLPLILSESDFEEMISHESLEGFEKKQLEAFYSLKNIK